MSRYYAAVWLQCAYAGGCANGVQADGRHVDNLTASGGWHCDEHEGEAV